MTKYLKNVNSFQELKNQFRTLLKENHPDNGGDAEVMKEINCEYDALFPIWKERAEKANALKEEEKTETAQSTRRHFYSDFGWAGSRYDNSLTLKEIAQIVRAYVKEKYPNCKFCVRTKYTSMCQELHVSIKEFPEKMYKTADDLRDEGLYEHVKVTLQNGEPYEYDKYTDEVEEMERRLRNNQLFALQSWSSADLIEAYERAIEMDTRYAIRTEYFRAVIEDVDAFVKSYNYDDSDAMTDYFDVNFYYFGCQYAECKQVVKTARIKNTENKPRAQKAEKKATEPERPESLEQKTGYTYKITKGEDTRDGSELWLVRIVETLDKAAYIAENQKIKALNGYYSKFRKAFIFRYDPTEALKTA